ncbi:uncharacterized protein LOC144941213 [Lampetra fluviatilis]
MDNNMACNELEDKKQPWDAEEIEALVSLWADESVQTELESSVRNEKVYARISADLKEIGINRSLKQCREKAKKLKHEYKMLKRHNEQGGAADQKKSKYYHLFDSVLGNRPAKVVSGSSNSTALSLGEVLDSPQESENASSVNSTSYAQPGPSSATHVTSPRTTQGKKRKRTDASNSVSEFAKCMRDSDERFMDFLRQEMRADREMKERQMNLDREQSKREAEASASLNRDLVSFLGQLGQALLPRNTRDFPLD